MASSTHSQLSNVVLHVLTVLCIILSASAERAFISIDCGSSADSYQDKNLITWTGDGNYTSTGESHVVPSISSESHVMDTLRVFKNGRKKNCYNINSVKQGRVLLRAHFHYGNYDDRYSPPRFDLHYDGNFWATVHTLGVALYYEVIYVMKRDSISVCVSQIREGEFPFISAIEVRGLEMDMYNNIGSKYPLFLMKRDAYGRNSSIRYGDDPYDRIWNPDRAFKSSEVIEVRNDATCMKCTYGTNQVPLAVFRNAVISNRTDATIHLSTGSPSNYEYPGTLVPIYLTWYFSEVATLGANENRSFYVILGDQISDSPVSPPYGGTVEVSTWNWRIFGNTRISLVPTNTSTLPPSINAMEVFKIGPELTNGTHINDVKGLASLQDAFDELKEWKGDPCLPAPYSWDWIVCSNETTPRVTALNLSSYGLSGVLPDFSSMDALRTIDLHNNNLQGPIPDFLGTFPDLIRVRLGMNQFNSSIPASLAR